MILRQLKSDLDFEERNPPVYRRSLSRDGCSRGTQLVEFVDEHCDADARSSVLFLNFYTVSSFFGDGYLCGLCGFARKRFLAL